jgi:hypothetical protein
VDKEAYPRFANTFGATTELVILRGAKRKYWTFTGKLTTQNVISFIELILNGGGKASVIMTIPLLPTEDDVNENPAYSRRASDL